MPLLAAVATLVHPPPHQHRKALTSINTKLGVGSSSSDHHPVVIAPVALPGLTKNLPSIS